MRAATRHGRLAGRYRAAWATFSTDKGEQYRYALGRTWGTEGLALFIMLNPSTADEDTLDPTLRRCEGFARDWGLSGFVVCNLFALRATDPTELRGHDDPTGPENDAFIDHWASHLEVDLVVCGWGAFPAKLSQRDRPLLVTKRLMDQGRAPLCLGRTKAGDPRHPLYLSKTTTLEAYNP